MSIDKEELRAKIIALGADLCGFAPVERFSEVEEGFRPSDVWSDCRTVISLAVAMPKGLTMVDSRFIYAHYNIHSEEKCDEVAYAAAMLVESLGAVAVPLPSDGPYEYWDKEHLTGKGILSMKRAALLAGLGSIGKNTLLTNEKYGNLISVGAILTDLELEGDPLAPKLCIDGCNACVNACPVHAIKDGHVDQSLCRPNTYGTTERGFGVVNCNRCRMVCPMRFGKRG